MHLKEEMEKPRMEGEDFEAFGLIAAKANQFLFKVKKGLRDLESIS